MAKIPTLRARATDILGFSHKPWFLVYNPRFLDLLCTWRAVNHHGLCEKPRIVKSRPVIVNFKTRFRVETYDCRLFVHLASIMVEKLRFISCITGFSTNS